MYADRCVVYNFLVLVFFPELLQPPLSNFVCLKLVKAHETDDNVSLPFILRRLIGREYHVGPDGVVIGTAPTCNIRLPAEGDILPEHCCIKFVGSSQKEDAKAEESKSRSGRFVLEDLTDGLGIIYMTDSHSVYSRINEENDDETDEEVIRDSYTGNEGFPVTITHGVQFVTGKLVWNLFALPEDVAFKANVFYLADHGNLPQLKHVLDGEENVTIPKLTITGMYKT